MIPMWWFTCPAGHLGLVEEDQAEGRVSIVCDQCDFHGHVDEGKLGKMQYIPDAMGHATHG